MAKSKYYWTEQELEILRSFYKKIPIDDLVKKLPGRNRAGVHNQSIRLGLSAKKPEFTPECKQKIEEFHKAGMTDRQMALHLKIYRVKITKYREKLGLPRNKPTNKFWYQTAQKTCSKFGVPNLRQLSLLRLKQSLENGEYPKCENRVQEWTMKFLELGPRTRDQLQKLLGIRKSSMDKTLRQLKKLGLIRPDKSIRPYVWEVSEYKEDPEMDRIMEEFSDKTPDNIQPSTLLLLREA